MNGPILHAQSTGLHSGVGKGVGAMPPANLGGPACVLPLPNIKVVGQLILGTFSHLFPI